MKTKFNQKVFFIGLVTLLLLASSLYAKPFSGDWETVKVHRGGNIENMIKELNLTPEQQEQLKKHRTEHMGRMKELSGKNRSKEKELKRELEKQDTDKNKINGLVEEIAALEKSLLEERVQEILSMKRILTQEQFEKFVTKLKVRKGKRKKE